MKIKAFLSPALVLFFLSPMIGELLSGSAPPAEFFNPLGLVMLAILYGGGAIMVRELTHRWGKSWPTLLVLGAAYGIAEEGLMCKSFFDPAWMDLGPLASYGRWAGVNWVWATELTIYHAVFSIAVPVLLVGVLFPRQRQQVWIGTKRLIFLFALWVLNAVVIFLLISPFRPPVLHYLSTTAISVALCVLAWRLPQPVFAFGADRGKAAHWFWFLLIGFLGTLALFFLAWVLPNTSVHPAITILLMVGLVILVGWAVLRLSGGGMKGSDKHRLALASGALGFFIFLAPLQELDKNRTDNTKGMALVALAAAILLIWMALRIRCVESQIKEVALK